MATLGFTTYVRPTVTQPTVQEILAALSGEQKSAILDAFANKVLPVNFKEWMDKIHPGVNKVIPRSALRTLYNAIDGIEVYARIEMRGERLITEAVVDENGVETSPAVYNTPPSTAAELLSATAGNFSDVYTSTEVEAVLTKMVLYSSRTILGVPNGTWAIYSTNVVL